MTKISNLKELFEIINLMSYFEKKEIKPTRHLLSYYFQDTISYNHFKHLDTNIYINLYCINCQKEQVFDSKLYIINGNYFYLKNSCKICLKSFYSYFILWMEEKQEQEKYQIVYTLEKSGSTVDTSELEIPNEYLKEIIQEELYKKAIVSFKNGLFTGSYIYFRKLFFNFVEK